MRRLRTCLIACVTGLMIGLCGFALIQQAIATLSRPPTICDQMGQEISDIAGKEDITRNNIAKIQALTDFLTHAYHHAPYLPSIDPENHVKKASYTIYRDDRGFVHVRNETTGEIEFNGTDASAAIQSAIDSLVDSGKILIKSGTYSLTSSLVGNHVKGTIIEGEGDSTILSVDADVNGFNLLLTNDWAIRNLKVKGNRPSRASGHGINLVRCANVRISDVTIDSVKGCGINLWHCNGCRVEDFYIHGCGLGGIFLNTNFETLVQNGRIENVALDAFPNGPCGIEIFAENTHSSQNTVSNVYFYRTRCEAVGIWSEDDNKIYSCVSVEAGYGVSVGNQAFILNSQADRNILANNLAIGSTGTGGIGFYVFGSAENLLLGNVAFSNDGYGIWIDAGEGQTADRNRIIGNMFICNAKYGGRIDEGDKNEWIGNVFYSNDYGSFHLVGGSSHIFKDNVGLSY